MAKKGEMIFPYVFAAVLTICCTLLGYDVTQLTGFNGKNNIFVSKIDHKKYPDVAQKYRFELIKEEDQ